MNLAAGRRASVFRIEDGVSINPLFELICVVPVRADGTEDAPEPSGMGPDLDVDNRSFCVSEI